MSTDSLRVDHLGAYGGAVRTPNFDRFAQEGTLFRHAYSENLPTVPTRTVWWTGRYQSPFRGWQPLEFTDYVLPEILWDRGYTSALITDTYHLHKPVFNFGRGFDEVCFIRGQEYDPWIVDRNLTVDLRAHHKLRGDASDATWQPRFEQYLRNVGGRKSEAGYSASRVTRAAVEWLQKAVLQQKDHLFLWVDYFDPHEPWDPPPAYAALYHDPAYRGIDIWDPVPGDVAGYLTPEEVQHVKANYAGEVSFVDACVGQLLDEIRRLGLYEQSLVMWVSDHGEPFGEHGIIRKARPWLYEELVHIPWVVRLPGGEGSGATVDALVQPTDLLPTILDALNIETPLTLPYVAPQRGPLLFPQDVVRQRHLVELTGKSLLPLLHGETTQIRDFALVGIHNQQWALYTHDWAYLHTLDEQQRAPELYDRRNDLTQQHNVLASHPAVARDLELELRRFVAKLRNRN
ncbi:MAG: sulfatase [Chloroflexi bacterium]|nr:sulfatase [Chloroflexota bacterium]